MADSKGTPTRQDFPEVKDKIVSSVEVSTESDYFGITISFHDHTTLNFTLESFLLVSPAYSQWKQGEETVLKQWPSIQSVIHDS